MVSFLDDPRLVPLLPLLKPGKGPCPFVASGAGARQALLTHYYGGRDATYVVVQRTSENGIKRDAEALSVMIGYAPFVEGTTIIYDLVAEQMQGKARPFECLLSGRTNRIFAVLPYQIERVGITISPSRRPLMAEVRFLDARDEPLQAAFPFQWRLSRQSHRLANGYTSTDEQGRSHLALPATQGNGELMIRSLLTGAEDRFQVGVACGT
jgi:hypothetical protein